MGGIARVKKLSAERCKEIATTVSEGSCLGAQRESEKEADQKVGGAPSYTASRALPSEPG